MRAEDLRWIGLLATCLVAIAVLTAKTDAERDQAQRAGWFLTLCGAGYLLVKGA